MSWNSLGWFKGKSTGNHGFYHQIDRAFRSKFAHHPILWGIRRSMPIHMFFGMWSRLFRAVPRLWTLVAQQSSIICIPGGNIPRPSKQSHRFHSLSNSHSCDGLCHLCLVSLEDSMAYRHTKSRMVNAIHITEDYISVGPKFSMLHCNQWPSGPCILDQLTMNFGCGSSDQILRRGPKRKLIRCWTCQWNKVDETTEKPIEVQCKKFQNVRAIHPGPVDLVDHLRFKYIQNMASMVEFERLIPLMYWCIDGQPLMPMYGQLNEYHWLIPLVWNGLIPLMVNSRKFPSSTGFATHFDAPRTPSAGSML